MRRATPKKLNAIKLDLPTGSVGSDGRANQQNSAAAINSNKKIENVHDFDAIIGFEC